MKRYLNQFKKSFIKNIEYKGKEILLPQDGNDYIRDLIQNNKPFLVTRIGGVELEILNYFLHPKNNFDDYIKNKAHKHAGIFPESDEILSKVSLEYLNGISSADCIGVWYNKNEGNIIQKINNECKLVELRGLEPYYHNNPWSSLLEGKKVLVIHPFKESIEKQYLKREALFQENILPNFKLEVIKSVQSMKGNAVDHEDWIKALDYMKSEIIKKDFDIAIIGAGAYGLPLGAFIKSIGKQAIHMGGSTQILFGIRGKRWDNHDYISNLYNEYWIRPNLSEIYEGANKVEGGCYW